MRLPDLSTSLELTTDGHYKYTATVGGKPFQSWRIPVDKFSMAAKGICINTINNRTISMRLSSWMQYLADEWATLAFGTWQDFEFEHCLQEIERRYTELLLNIAIQNPPNAPRLFNRKQRRRAMVA